MCRSKIWSRANRVCTLLGLAAALLVGCRVLRPTPTPQPVTITFAPTGPEAAHYPSLVARFREEHPNVTVELTSASDESADAFVAPGFMLGFLQSHGSIIALDPYMEGDEAFEGADLLPGVLRTLGRDGQTWAIPSGADVVVTYYNEGLFDEYGVAHPERGWTWDDFLGTASDLRDPAAGVFGYAPMDVMMDALMIIYQHGGWVFDDVAEPTRVTFDAPEVIAALEWLASMIHTYNVAPTREQFRGEPFGGVAQIGVYANKVGMWFGWWSERGGGISGESTWPAAWKMRWGMVPMPRDQRSGVLALVYGYSISSRSGHPDAAWDWIAWLSRQTPRQAIPVRHSLLESEGYERLVGSEVADIARASLQGAELIPAQVADFSLALHEFSRALEQIIDGRATPAEAMERAQELAGQ